MDYNGGPYDRDPYGRDPEGRDEGYSDEPYGRGNDRGQQGYGQSPYGDSRYGQSPYDQSPYGGDFSSTGRTRMPRDEYGTTGRTQMPRDDYGSTGRTRMPRDEYGTTGRTQMPRDDYGSTGRTQMPRDEYGTTGRTRMPRDGEDYGRGYGDDARGYGDDARGYGDDARGYGDDARGYGDDARGYGDDARGYGDDARGYGDDARGYGDDARGRGGDDRYGRSEREFSNTGRTDMRQSAYGDDAFGDSGQPADELYDDGEAAARAPRKKKKKRSKFARIMRGLGAYIAELPTKSLILFGGIVAVVLVGVILLVVFLPKTEKPAQVPDSGTLGIEDVVTPTPSLAPTAPPEVTPEPSAEPLADPFNGGFIKDIGEENDVIPAVQERLVELGYMEMPEGGYTKRYGKATKSAVRIFQVKNYADSKDWDGILGLGTYRLLMGDEAQAFYLKRGDGGTGTSELTDLVNAVKKLQARLVELGYMGAGSDTGVFGTGTAKAVQTFQQYHGLTADGWAGQGTLQVLYSAEAMNATTGAANDKSKLTASPAGADAATTPDPNATAPDAAVDDTAASASPDAGTVAN